MRMLWTLLAATMVLRGDAQTNFMGGISLSWSAPTNQPGMIGYLIYSGPASGLYGSSVVSVGGATNYTIAAASIPTGVSYWTVASLGIVGSNIFQSTLSDEIVITNTLGLVYLSESSGDLKLWTPWTNAAGAFMPINKSKLFIRQTLAKTNLVSLPPIP